MAERQYIGARYVPVFADPIEWDKSRAYEALTIVTYLASTYTSKLPVPPGTEITNTKYWALTASYNSQFEEYRREVEEYREQVTDFIAQQTGINSHGVLVVGDDYCTTKYATNPWPNIAANKLGLVRNNNYFNFSANGAGVNSAGTETGFDTILTNGLSGMTQEQKNKIDTFIFPGSINDVLWLVNGGNVGTLMNNATALVELARANLPNLRNIYMALTGWSVDTNTRKKAKLYYENVHKITQKYFPINAYKAIMMHFNTMATDGKGPKQLGMNYMGNYIAGILEGEETVVDEETPITISGINGTKATLVFTQQGTFAAVRGSNQTVQLTDAGSGIILDSPIAIGTWTGNIFGNNQSSGTFADRLEMDCLLVDSSGTKYQLPVTFDFYRNINNGTMDVRAMISAANSGRDFNEGIHKITFPYGYAQYNLITG